MCTAEEERDGVRIRIWGAARDQKIDEGNVINVWPGGRPIAPRDGWPRSTCGRQSVVRGLRTTVD
jgi:hypothetical protein